MPLITEYKLTRSSGVLGLRSTGKGLGPNGSNIAYFEFVGVSIDTETDVYRAKHTDGSEYLSDYYEFNPFWKVSRIDHPELGRILYADLNDQPVYLNLNNSTVLNVGDIEEPEVAYIGTGGSIQGEGTAYRYRMLGGEKFIVYSGEMPA